MSWRVWKNSHFVLAGHFNWFSHVCCKHERPLNCRFQKILALIASVANVHCNCFTIVDKSEITTHPSNVTKTEGENVTLHCNATGYPLPTLSWTKDGSGISNNSRISFSADKKQLAITKANRVDRGAYRCVANNSLGNDTSMAAVVDVQCKSTTSYLDH